MLFHPIMLPLLTLLFSYVIFCILRKLRSNPKLKLPPSPPRIPIIGNFHQITPLFHQFLHQMSLKYGPLVLFKFGSKPTLVVSSAEATSDILKTHDIIFADRFPAKAFKILFFGGNDIIMSPYNEQWKQLRKFCVVELLSPKRVNSFKHIREEEVDKMIQNIARERGGVVNLTETVFTVLNAIVFRCSLGDNFNKEYTDGFIELIEKANSLAGAFSFGDFFPWLQWLDIVSGFDAKLRNAAKELNIFFDQIIDDSIRISSQVDHSHHDKDEKKSFKEILISHAGKNNSSFTRECMKGLIMDMFVGGIDTSATVVDWAMAELIKNPKLMKKAQEEVRRVVGNKTNKVEEHHINQMDYLKCIVKETLRMHPPIPTYSRRSSGSAKIGGCDIPPNMEVFINVWTFQRDPKLWDEAEEFRPERFINNPIDFKGQDFQFIPFGSGRRGCPGMSFGLAVVELVLANLLFAFDWELPGGASSEELDMDEKAGFTIMRRTPIQVVPVPFCATFS
ncbi:cytochrome P450 71A1-like [Papaver somniferum]|uniref:cytochrome P450 71A1-like n=1 Tax=Papaver somniferum TaxID=3469 RepID=UPI000E6F4D1E|nr:cytochrome P450 71A1-like [Papaver somniferum]